MDSARKRAEEALARWDALPSGDVDDLAAWDVARDGMERFRALLASEPETKHPGHDRIAELESLLRECNAVCLCGCPESEHESYGEDGESCGHDDHECLRVPRSVLSYVNGLRAAIAEEREKSAKAARRAEKAAVALARAHEVIAQQRSLIDPEQHPEIDAAAGEVIDPCDEFADRMDRAEADVRTLTAERDRLREQLAEDRRRREEAEGLRRARESNFLTCTDSRVRAEGNRVLLLEVDALRAALRGGQKGEVG